MKRAEILQRFEEEFKNLLRAMHPSHGEKLEDFITRECLELKKKTREKQICTHRGIDYDCPCWHDGYETGNAEPPLSEQKKWEKEV